MKLDKTTKAAMQTGRQQATEVLAFRAKALKRRAKALNTHVKKLRAGAKSAKALEALPKTVTTAGVLIAEGDSWFDYPFHDILEMLEDDHGYDVESVAHKGDSAENMAYGDNQLEEFTRRIEKMIRRNTIPKAILLSAGGNDIAGDGFAMLLNHVRSSSAGLNEQIVAGVIDQRIQEAYFAILSAVTTVCESLIGHALPILLHGYDYPVPDGRGFLGGLSFLPGPWLEPGFREKGFDNLKQNTGVVEVLINRFNAMVKRVSQAPGFEHVKFIDLRNTLTTGPNYKDLWANEMHPTGKGFSLVTDRFVQALQKL